MLWKDLLGGFLIAGLLAAFVPDAAWTALFLHGAPPAVQLVGNAVVGPLIAVVSFVCSIGNVPLAAILWASGISFGGVLAFLYADLIVLPLLDIYRRYYGARMMLYIAGVFFVTMVLAAILMDAAFSALHLVPAPNPNVRAGPDDVLAELHVLAEPGFARARPVPVAAERPPPDAPRLPRGARIGLSGSANHACFKDFAR